MTSIKVKFRPSATDGKEGSIYYQVIRNRAVRQIGTELRLYESEWDKRTASVRIYGEIGDSRKKYLQAVAERVRWDCKCLQAVIARLERKGGNYTADDVAGEFNSRTDGLSLFHFMQGIIGQLSFRNGQDLLLCELDEDTALLYEAWLKGRGNCPNTVSFYMRILRAVYNRAVEKGLTEQKHPFKHVYTGIDKTVKRAVPLEAIRRIKGLDLTLKPHLDYARDMFLFSFYTRGMSFIDMAYLRKSDLKDGILTYRRRKTGQRLSVRWESCMEEIVVKYKDAYNTEYLLPIITDPLADGRKQYRNAIYRVNTALKKVARLAGFSVPLTMYYGRHSWASIAKSKNIPLSVISEGMGHDSEETTRIYLASLDTSVIDEANSLILKSL